MTEKDLCSLYYLNIELRRIQKQIDAIKAKKRELALDAAIGRATVTGMPKSPSPSNALENSVVNRLAMLEQLDFELDKQLTRYSEKRLEYERRKSKIEDYINAIDDEELKSIFNYRCIEQMSWAEIGTILFIDRRTASRKYYQYIKMQKK